MERVMIGIDNLFKSKRADAYGTDTVKCAISGAALVVRTGPEFVLLQSVPSVDKGPVTLEVALENNARLVRRVYPFMIEVKGRTIASLNSFGQVYAVDHNRKIKSSLGPSQEPGVDGTDILKGFVDGNIKLTAANKKALGA